MGEFVGLSVDVLVGVSVGVLVNESVGVSVEVLVGVSVSVFVAVSVGVLVGAISWVMVLVSNVTAPVCAKARPFNVTPVLKVMVTRAMMVPLKSVLPAKVQLLPTCQKILAA